MLNWFKKHTEIIPLLAFLLGWCVGYWYCYQKYVPNLKSQLKICNLEKNGLEEKTEVKVTEHGKTEITYITKRDKSDNDVEIKDKSNVSVKYNDTKIDLPSNINESHKFDKGKLVIDKKDEYRLDLTDTINNLADEKAKNYSRIGKADFGVLYSNKDSDLYGGFRYNAKAYDIGYYHNVAGSDWIIGLHYKF